MKSSILVSIITLIIVLIQSCKKEDNTVLTDIDGNVYSSMINIGTQVWMAENLRTTRYSNGDTIETTSKDLSDESTPEYQWAYNGDESNVEAYGRLYTWYAVTDSRNVCPTGWHVPTDGDWTTLTTFLGGEDTAGDKLKETGSTHWLLPSQKETNESNFTALPGGCRNADGVFTFLGYKGFWWSSTEQSGSLGYSRVLSGIFRFVGRDGTDKKYGFSVRCVKDN